jgi:hypothetical protein
MDEKQLAAEIAVILQAPIVSLLGVIAVAAAVWKIIDWAYRLRIEALLERLALANDRLVQSTEEVAKLRHDLSEAKSKATAFPGAPSDFDIYISKLGNIEAANTATAQVTKFTDDPAINRWIRSRVGLRGEPDLDLAHSPS